MEASLEVGDDLKTRSAQNCETHSVINQKDRPHRQVFGAQAPMPGPRSFYSDCFPVMLQSFY